MSTPCPAQNRNDVRGSIKGNAPVPLTATVPSCLRSVAAVVETLFIAPRVVIVMHPDLTVDAFPADSADAAAVRAP